ncbi:hypothetical protein [Gemmiger sp.]|uniref:hypothetical protein n=2 Tax=Gemmiger sp. TaxID=2049027 RepID=UPI003A956B50
MRKQTRIKKVVSLALATVMAVSVCTTALADNNTADQGADKSTGEIVGGTNEGTPKEKATLETQRSSEENQNAVQSGEDTEDSLNAAIANGGTVTLQNDVTANLEVPGDVTVTIDLNGHTITSSGSHAIENHGNLTVQGEGKIVSKDGGKAALYNAPGATAALNGGTFSGDTWYVIKNLGTLTMDGANLVQNDTGSSAIDNGYYGDPNNDCGVTYPTQGASVSLTIKSGEFSGGMNTVKNDDFGVLTIDGGVFTNTDGPAVLNWNEATINGGTFTVNNSAKCVLANGALDTFADKGAMWIKGGTFNAADNGNGSVLGYGGGSTKGMGYLYVQGGNFNGTIYTGLPYEVRLMAGVYSAEPPAEYVHKYYYVEQTDKGYELKMYATVGYYVDNTGKEFGTPFLSELLEKNDINGKTIYLVHDASQAITIPEGVTVTIDLAGFTLTNDQGETTITNNGNLTIMDSKGTGRVVKEGNGIALFNNGTLAISGGTFGTVALKPGNQNLTVSGGKFKEEVHKDYLADGKVCTASGDAEFPYMVGDPVKEVPAEEVKVEPAKPESTVDEKAAENAALDGSITKEDVKKAAENIKVSESSANAIADAVVKEATVNGSSVEDTSAKEIAAKALTEAEDIHVAPDDTVRIVTQPKLVVAPLSAKNVEGAGKSLTFDIKLVYDVKATIADKNENMVTEGAGKNTVVLEENKPLKSEVAMDITLDDVSAIAIPEGDKESVLVRHEKDASEGGAVYYYNTKTETANGVVQKVTFTNPHGFSVFTVLVDDRVVTVSLNGKSYTYDITASSVAVFPYQEQAGSKFVGYQFDGIEGTYTTMTEDLFNKLFAAGKAVAGKAVYAAVGGTDSTPTATPAPTAVPKADTNLYYTCTACGYHNWTATADGYKCDHCGHLESVKQLSGYANVKGVYTPKSSTAAAAKAGTISTIPQTSDDMPIVPIAVVAIAALLGLGVTAYWKKQH